MIDSINWQAVAAVGTWVAAFMSAFVAVLLMRQNKKTATAQHALQCELAEKDAKNQQRLAQMQIDFQEKQEAERRLRDDVNRYNDAAYRNKYWHQ